MNKPSVQSLMAVLVVILAIGAPPHPSPGLSGHPLPSSELRSGEGRGPEGGVRPDGFVGTCYSFYPDPYGQVPGRPFLPLMIQAGSRWDRFDFSWPRLEPREGQWDFAAQDALVGDLRTAGMNILGILLWTPDWAATGECITTTVALAAKREARPAQWYAPSPRPTIAPTGPPLCMTTPPRGLYEEWNDWTIADNDPINYWGRFVYTITYRYRDSVKHWEVWNEPDLSSFWSGTSTDYAQLLKVAYRATKAACPDCTVLFGGLAYYEKPNFYRWVLNQLKDDPDAPAHNYYFDAMAVHLYSRSSSIYDVTQTIRNGMREFVPDRPIWLTETGVPVWDDASVISPTLPYIWSATQEEAASFVLQSYANARAVGLVRYFFFRAHDDYCDKNRDGDCADKGIDYGMHELFGLARNDRSLRPAYAALQVATTYLVSPTLVTSVNYASGVRRVTFWGTPWGKISVLWNTVPTPMTFAYPAILPTATLVDQAGVTRTITATGGTYSLLLPGATANNGISPSDYIIGGRTYLVIEADIVPPTATAQVTATGALTLAVSWSGTDDATAIWRYDVQAREGTTGIWATWLNFTTATSALYTASRPGLWCFRARAWDSAGNRGDWSEAACATTLRDLRVVVESVFGDADGDGTQGPDELPVTATLRLLDAVGAGVAPPVVGTSAELTATVPPGPYWLDAVPLGWPSPPSGWLPRRIPLEVPLGPGPLEIRARVGLSPHRASVFLPLVCR
ncbi:MAG: hypothetical protein NZ769_01695 [Anaerolineae bacterium]|nr:hypothetical protein [Anaerolineae bacterium]